VVLGAGYAGFPSAKRLARQVYPEEVSVALVTESPRFVERPRLHQLATGQQLRDLPLADLLAGSAVGLRLGWVHAIDRARRSISVATENGTETLAYDTLVYALGSTIELDAVPGVRAYTRALTGPEASDGLRSDLTRLPAGATVLVCGGGLTGIETAAEIAEAFPGLRVRLVTAGRLGAWLSAAAQRYLTSMFERLGVEVSDQTPVAEVTERGVRVVGGPDLPFDLCVWAGGFTVPTLAAEAGLPVDPQGRIVTDDHLRSITDPRVLAIGDAAAIPGAWGDALAMGCRTGGFTGPYAADLIAHQLWGKPTAAFRYRYLHECISLGRHHGLVQFLHRDESPKSVILTGRAGLAYKELTLRGAVLLFRSPGPYPPRRRHVRADLARLGADEELPGQPVLGGHLGH
jgi:NADH dehydrogenase FAD-containing subunit